MARPGLLYFGRADLAATVFEKYMAVLGFETAITLDRGQLLGWATSGKVTIAVLANQEPADELLDFARELQSHFAPGAYTVLVLGDDEYLSPDGSLNIVSRPYRLTQIAGLISQLARKIESASDQVKREGVPDRELKLPPDPTGT